MIRLDPIKLPTWGHISQIAVQVRDTACPWFFFKTDHASAYNHLPLDPSDQALSVVALRNPSTGKWMALVHRSLLFGAVDAALHYHCFSRAVAVVFTRVTGIPLLCYFDDFGALAPAAVLDAALGAFVRFCDTLRISPKEEKTEKGPVSTFHGIRGIPPTPCNKMTLSV